MLNKTSVLGLAPFSQSLFWKLIFKNYELHEDKFEFSFDYHRIEMEWNPSNSTKSNLIIKGTIEKTFLKKVSTRYL